MDDDNNRDRETVRIYTIHKRKMALEIPGWQPHINRDPAAPEGAAKMTCQPGLGFATPSRLRQGCAAEKGNVK